MTQDSSINKASKPAREKLFSKAVIHNGKMNVKSNMKLMVVLFILHLAAAPLALSMLIINILTKGSNDFDVYAIIGVFTTGAAAAAGIICALSSMPYLYKKSVTDMRYALPMTTAQRFVSDFLSGLFIYIVPFILSSILTGIITLTGHLLCDGNTYIDQRDPYTWTCVIFENAAPFLLKGIIGGILLMIMFYALTVIVASCCGSLFECICYTVFANGFIPGMAAALVAAVTDHVDGIDAEFYMARYIIYSSPIGGAIGLVAALENDASTGNSVPLVISFGVWAVKFLAVTVLYCIAAFLIYRKRKAEDTGKPVVFGVFYHIIMTMCIVTISSLFLMEFDSSMLIPLIIITGIIYMVLTVIKNRGFSGFGKGIIGYVITMAVSFGVFFGGAAGVDAYVTNHSFIPESISAAYLSYRGYYTEPISNNFGSMMFSGNYLCPVVKETENIRTVVNALESSKSYNDGTLTHDTFRVLLKMKSGQYVLRTYPMTQETMDILSALDTTQEFKKQMADIVSFDIDRLSRYDAGNDNYTHYISLYPQWGIDMKKVNNIEEISLKKLPEYFMSQLDEAYRKDIMAISSDDYYRNRSKVWSVNCANFSDRLIINEHYTNTVAVLSAAGFDLSSDQVLTDKETFAMIDGFTVTMTGSEYTDMIYSKYGFAQMWLYRNEFIKLLNCANKMYKYEDGCYTISVNGNRAVIPPEYNSLAQKAYIQVVADEFIRQSITEKLRKGYDDTDYIDDSYAAEDMMQIMGIMSENYSDEYSNYFSDSPDYVRFLKRFTSRYSEAGINASGYKDIYKRMMGFITLKEYDNGNEASTVPMEYIYEERY